MRLVRTWSVIVAISVPSLCSNSHGQEIKFDSQAVVDKVLTVKSAKGQFKVASPDAAADAKGTITVDADVAVDTKCAFGVGVRQSDDTRNGYLILFNRYSDQVGQLRIFHAGVWPPPDLSENAPLDMKQGTVLK